MTQSTSEPNQFTIQNQAPQNQATDSSRQPLEVRHLSHDLRGPLNSILGFSELLLEGVEGPLNETQSEDITAIRHSAQNLLQLINTIVDLSKLATDGLNIECVNVSLQEVLQKTQQVIKRETSVALEIDLAQPMPLISGDGDRIGQIILAVARFFINSKKVNTISTRLEHNATDATFHLIAPQFFIPDSEREELFELTVRVDSGGHSKLSPGGLELPLAWQLAAKQNGYLSVESNEESGTTFFLNLPLSAAE